MVKKRFMTKKDRELYEKEVERIRREQKVPDDVPIVILDVDQESCDWIPGSNLPTPQSKKARARFKASQNREEGGE